MKVRLTQSVAGKKAGDTVDSEGYPQQLINQWLNDGKAVEVRAVKVAKKPTTTSKKPVKVPTTKKLG